MSMTQSGSTGTIIGETAAYGGLVDALGGLATVVLAIIGLAHMAPELLASIGTIIFGAALLIQGGTLLSEFAAIMFPPEATAPTTAQFGGGGLTAVFLSGATGVVLGILALMGIVPAVLTSAAVIAFGAALILSSSSVWQLHHLKRSVLAERSLGAGGEILANEVAYGSAGMQALAGLGAIVLGVLALSGINAVMLTLVALLALGGTLIFTGSTLSENVIGFMRPTSSAIPGARGGVASRTGE
jgi:hypothetical protein